MLTIAPSTTYTQYSQRSQYSKHSQFKISQYALEVLSSEPSAEDLG